MLSKKNVQYKTINTKIQYKLLKNCDYCDTLNRLTRFNCRNDRYRFNN